MNGASSNACVSWDVDNGVWTCATYQTIFSATYNAASQPSTLSYGSGWTGTYNEQFSYNTLGQVTALSIPGTMGIAYNYTAGANNGRISSVQDSAGTVNYTYDALNRLTNAQSTLGWSEAYTYIRSFLTCLNFLAAQ